MGIKAEDIIADHENYAVLDGVTIRKGTIGAALANAETLISNNSTTIASSLSLLFSAFI